MSVIRRSINGVCFVSIGVLIGRWTFPASTVSAQVASSSRELMIGPVPDSVPVRLGMTKDAVLSALKKRYKVEEVGDEFWHVQSSDDTFQSLGGVKFRQNRLVSASRAWGEIKAEDSLVSFFQKVYGAFDSASSQTRTGTLTCKTSRQPNGTYTFVTLAFGIRSVSFYLVEKRLAEKPVNTIYVEEILIDE